MLGRSSTEADRALPIGPPRMGAPLVPRRASRVPRCRLASPYPIAPNQTPIAPACCGAIVQCSTQSRASRRHCGGPAEGVGVMSSVSASAKSPAAPQLDLERCAEAASAAERLLHLAKSGVRKAVEASGSLDASQAAAHGLAWVATYVEALRQMLGWARRLEAEGRLGEMERLITSAAIGEYLAQLAGGIPMSQVETVRLSALGVPRAEIRRFEEQVGGIIDGGTDDGLKARLAELIAAQPAVTTFGDTGL